jgi:hypothetical protein
MPRNDKKAYASVIARIPQDLVDAVKRYAGVHRCSVSELIREGLEMRLDADVPGRSADSRRDSGGEVLHEVLHTLHTLSPMLRAAVQGTVRETVTEVLHEVLSRSTRVQQAPEKVLQGHTSEPQGRATTRRGITEVLSQDTADAPVSQHGAGFDTTRFLVGELCPEKHAYLGTGQSLRYLRGDHDCVTCRRERNERYNAQKRARRTAAGGLER